MPQDKPLQAIRLPAGETVAVLKMVVRNAPTALALLDRELRYIAYSQRWLIDYDSVGQDLHNKCYFDVLPNLPTKWIEASTRCLQGASISVEDATYERPDGQVDYISWQCMPWLDDNGEIGGILVNTHHTNHRMELQNTLRRERKLYQALAQNIPNAFSILLDLNETILIAEGCRQLRDVLELGSVLEGSLLCDALPSTLYSALQSQIDLAKQGSHQSLEHAYRDLFCTINIVPIESGRHGIDTLLLNVLNVTEHKLISQQVANLASYDELTHLVKRNVLLELLEKILQEARIKKRMIALLWLDLDQFKLLNDSLGHRAGDRILIEVAFRLHKVIRKSDIVARVGGDEFVTVLTDIASINTCTEVADRILNTFNTQFKVDDQHFTLGTSIGISLFPADATNTEDLLQKASIALHKAKDSGRNQYHYYTADLDSYSHQHVLISSELRTAMAEDQLHMVYQPQYSATHTHLVGLETLVRWQHPTRGAIGPQTFIPIAEKSGLIGLLTDWIIHDTCRQLRAWIDQGLAVPRVSLNLSSISFREPQLTDHLLAQLGTWNLQPHHFMLELTETAIMNDVDTAIATLSKLKAAGFSISVDDFGTGYSSLNYLKRFPISELKIDKSFVDDIPDDADNAAIVRAIISLAHSLRLQVIAEGVETQQQFDFLKQENCDRIQGYLLSRPRPADEITTLLQPNNHTA